MRTTITLDPDVEALLLKAIEERKLSFQQAVNFAIREGLRVLERQREPFVQTVFNMGECVIGNDWSVQALADASFDQEFLRKMDPAGSRSQDI